jgi:hypothetical protein
MEFLKESDFYEKYDVHNFFNWQLIEKKEQSIPEILLRTADLVIYTPLSDVNGCYSTNIHNTTSFIHLLKPECQLISFPRLHNNSLFPIFRKHKFKKERKDYYGIIKNNISSVQELSYLYENNLIDFDFDTRVKNNYEIAKEKEADCDVKIADYISDNVSKHKMFLTQDHPTSRVINHVTKQITDILDIDYNFEKVEGFHENIIGYEDSIYGNVDKQYPISKYSIRHFGFTYIEKEHPHAHRFYLKECVEYYTNHMATK